MSNLSLLNFCLKCGNKCCKHGTPIVFADERERIIKFSGKDYFKKKENYFIIKEEPCPYLNSEGKCSIEKVKPIDCKAYPLGFFRENSKFKIGISQTCPAKAAISKKFISEAKNLLKNFSEERKQAYHNVSEKSDFKIREDKRIFQT